MKIMAVDYGDARTGIAFSDVQGKIVGETMVLKNSGLKKTAENIADLFTAKEAGRIVIGYPKNMNGSSGTRANLSELLREEILKCCDTDIILWDERLTTSYAQRILSNLGKKAKNQRKTIDAVAAAVILENYLAVLD